MTGFDPDEISDKSPLSLSGGERRRLAIAGVLAVRPDYLLLDEPIAGLDPTGRRDFIGLLKALNEDGMTIVIVSHNADAIAECADHLVLMKEGQIVRSGLLKDVISDREAVAECGVELSSPQRIAQLMAEKGVKTDQEVVSCSDLLSELEKIMKRKEEGEKSNR